MDCLFCGSDGPFTTREHAISESLGITNLILRDVCDSCNRTFSKIENDVLCRTPLALGRLVFGVPNKEGKAPLICTSMSRKEAERFPDHDQGILLQSSGQPGKIHFTIKNPKVAKRFLGGDREFRWIWTPRLRQSMGRFLGKTAIGITACHEPETARHEALNSLRRYARFGSPINKSWPFFVGWVNDKNPEVKVGYKLMSDDDNSWFIFRYWTTFWTMCITDPDVKVPDAALRLPEIAEWLDESRSLKALGTDAITLRF